MSTYNILYYFINDVNSEGLKKPPWNVSDVTDSLLKYKEPNSGSNVIKRAAIKQTKSYAK